MAVEDVGQVEDRDTGFEQTPHRSGPTVDEHFGCAELDQNGAGTAFERRHTGSRAENGDGHIAGHVRVHNGNHGVFRRPQIRPKSGLFFVGSAFDVTHDPTLELPVVFDVDLWLESVQLDFGAGRALVPAGRSDLTESFCGNGSGVFSNAVVAEDDNQFVREDAGNDAPINLVDAHEKIGDQYTDI